MYSGWLRIGNLTRVSGVSLTYDMADHARYDDRLDVVPFQKITEALYRARVFGVDVNIGVSAKILSRL